MLQLTRSTFLLLIAVLSLVGAGAAFAEPPPPPGVKPASEPPPPPGGGCQSDKDCKGNRICQNGQCVDPKGTTVPKPTVGAGRYQGSFGGGSITFRSTGKSVSQASITIRGQTFRLHGKGGSKFNLVGTSGADSVRVNGNIRGGGKSANGRYDGTARGKKVSGSWSATRR